MSRVPIISSPSTMRALSGYVVLINQQLTEKNDVHKYNRELAKTLATRLRDSLPQSLKRPMKLAQESGASSWLTSLSLGSHCTRERSMMLSLFVMIGHLLACQLHCANGDEIIGIQVA